MAKSLEEMMQDATASLAEMKQKSENASAEQKQKIAELETKLANVADKASFDGLKAQLDQMRKDFDELATRKPAQKDGKAKSLTDHLLVAFREKKDTLNSQASGGKGKGQMFELSLETKDVADMTLANNLSGSTGVPTYQPGIVAVPNALLHFRSLTGVLPSETDTYHFIRHNETIGEGGFGVQSTENTAKSARDYDFTDVTVNLNPLAGIVVVSRKMLRNIPALAAYLGQYLPEDYLQAEDAAAYAALVAASGKTTGSTAGNWDGILETIGLLGDAKYNVNGIVVLPSVYYTLLAYKGSTYDYNLPGVVTMEGGVMRVNGIPVFKANWVPADTAVIGDWTKMKIIQSEALNVRSTEFDGYNFSENNITYRCEAVVGYAVERPAAFSIIDLGFSA